MKKCFYIYLGMLFAFTACQNENSLGGDDEDKSIYLSATVGDDTASRVAYHLTTPSVENPLHSSVWASTTSRYYPNGTLYGNSAADNYKVEVHAQATFRGAEKQLLSSAIYPHNGLPVYFIGLFPHAIKWTTVYPANNVANCTFTGKEDVMYAPEVWGTYVGANDVENRVVTLHYYHLVTWLRLKIVAESEEVANAWGEIKSITIKSKNSLSIDLTKAATKTVGGNPVFDETCVTFGATETDFPFYGKDSDTEYATNSATKAIPYIPYDPDDNVVTNEKIKNHAEEVAYVLCAPVVATNLVDDGSGKGTKVTTNEYVITLSTEKRQNVTVNVDLKDAEGNFYGDGDGVSTMGKQFTVLLNFQLGNTIAVQTGLTGIDDWKHAGGIGEGHLGEQ